MWEALYIRQQDSIRETIQREGIRACLEVGEARLVPVRVLQNKQTVVEGKEMLRNKQLQHRAKKAERLRQCSPLLLAENQH